MSYQSINVPLNGDLLEAASRVAALDHIDVATLLESLLRRHVELVEAFAETSQPLPYLDLEDYELQRDEGETDDEYNERLSLFR